MQKTQGNECFYNSVSIGLLPSSTHDLGAEKLGILARAYTKTKLVTTPFSLPFDVRNIKKFEKKNDLKRRINVYTIWSEWRLTNCSYCEDSFSGYSGSV